jgi:hypothetical protein
MGLRETRFRDVDFIQMTQKGIQSRTFENKMKHLRFLQKQGTYVSGSCHRFKEGPVLLS